MHLTKGKILFVLETFPRSIPEVKKIFRVLSISGYGFWKYTGRLGAQVFICRNQGALNCQSQLFRWETEAEKWDGTGTESHARLVVEL